MPNAEVNLSLHHKQGIAFLSQATELAYGGAAGGGKSHLGRVMAIAYALAIPGLQIYLFRREHNELVKNHMEGVTSFPALLQPWEAVKKVRIVKNEIRFWNGSKIFLCNCQHEKDVFKWLGPEMYFLIIEQAEQFTEFMLRMLFGRNRMPEQINIAPQYAHLFPRVLYTFNPGGPGHAFFKKNFSDIWKKFRTDKDPFPVWQASKDEGGRRRQFIQARLEDNPSVNPEEYIATLSALPPRMKKALLEGDMDQVMGAFFPDLQRDVHLIRPFKIPSWWPRYQAMDWGACGEGDPYSIGYWTIADGSEIKRKDGSSIILPKGFALLYKCIRGHGKPKTTVAMVVDEIRRAEKYESSIQYRVAGGDIKKDDGIGTSIFQEFAKYGIYFRRADMRRIHGWQQMQERIVGKDNCPMLGYFEDGAECEEVFESTRSLQHDILGDPNEVAEGNDHDADMTRYFVMTKPWSKTKPAPEKTLPELFPNPTVDQLWEMREQLMRQGRR